MMLRCLPLIILLYTSGIVSGQEVVYVNTDKLILRDRPEKKYNVFAILHAPCELKVEPYDKSYKNDKAVTGKFYEVSISYNDDGGIHHYVGGWVLKKYVVPDLGKVTVKGLNTRSQVVASVVALITYPDEEENNPKNFNAARFQPPKYKGGEVQPLPAKRVYHSGPRGGCYYVGEKGKKNYVDKKFCNGR